MKPRHLNTSRAAFLALAAVVVFGGQPGVVHTQSAALKIVVLEGEGAVNIIEQKTAVAPVIEVRDRNNQPVSGAVVKFAIQKGKASFNGARTLSVTTDAAGHATAAGFTPTGTGALRIAASAAFQGQTAAATIAQATVATLAQASSIASGTAVAGGAGGTGGGLSGAAIAGIVGGAGAAAGGVLIAAKGGQSGSPSGTPPNPQSDPCRSSPFCGRWGVALPSPGLQFTACGGQNGPLGLSDQSIQVDANGAFNNPWGSLPVVQAAGTMTSTGVTGTLTCLSNGVTGTMSATPSGSDYVGTVTLSGVTIATRLTKVS